MCEVTISIVNYNQKQLLDRCLENIKSLSLPSAWKTVVVDNCSADGSCEMIRSKHPWVELIKLNKNTGYGGGHNECYRGTKSPVFVALNPDVIVLPGSLEKLVEVLGDFAKAAVVGPCLLNPDLTRQFSARRFYTWRTVLLRRFSLPGRKKVNDCHLMKDCPLETLSSVDWILGAVLCIKRAAFDDKYLFDTRYRLYFEDVDLCYFAGKRGWEVLYCPESRMIHDHQRASARKLWSMALVWHIVSWLKFCRKKRMFRCDIES